MTIQELIDITEKKLKIRQDHLSVLRQKNKVYNSIIDEVNYFQQILDLLKTKKK